jgi:hypothetical protein
MSDPNKDIARINPVNHSDESLFNALLALHIEYKAIVRG